MEYKDFNPCDLVISPSLFPLPYFFFSFGERNEKFNAVDQTSLAWKMKEWVDLGGGGRIWHHSQKESINKKRKISSKSPGRRVQCSKLAALVFYINTDVRKCEVGPGCYAFRYKLITHCTQGPGPYLTSLTWTKKVANWDSWKFYRETETQVSHTKYWCHRTYMQLLLLLFFIWEGNLWNRPPLLLSNMCI